MDSTNAKPLTAGQLAGALGLPESWLVSEAEGGRIPCLRAGRALRFNLRAVERALLRRAAIERRTAAPGRPA